MNNDELDRILSRSLAEEELVPSSGFAASVMEAVRREATEPPPIPFPWKRALAGLIAAGLTLVWVVIEIVLQLRHNVETPHSSAGWTSAWRPVLHAVMGAHGAWLALAGALVASAALSLLSMRLASGDVQRWERNH
jgi:hypothetical protein